MIEQRTEEWFQQRLGKVTASRISDVIAKTKTGVSTSRQNYEREDAARKLYEIERNISVSEVGFFEHPVLSMSGASPDGAVHAQIEGKYAGLIEIKCPIETTHTNTLMSKSVPSKYIPQMQWQLACTGASWVDFVSYNPNFPPELQLFISRVDRDQSYISELEVEVEKFLEEVEQTIIKLKE